MSDNQMYRNRGKVSPYVWSGDRPTGKYVADGQYDPNTVDQQLGIIPLVVAMMESAERPMR